MKRMLMWTAGIAMSLLLALPAVAQDPVPVNLVIPAIDAEQGTLTVKAQDGIELKDKDKVPTGTELTITLTAKEGYRVKTFTVNGEEWANDKTFTVADKDVVIVAELEADAPAATTLTITIPAIAAEQGTLTVTKEDGTALNDQDEVKTGDVLTISLTEGQGYKVKTFTVNDEEWANDKTFTVADKNVVIVAELEALALTVTIPTVENAKLEVKSANGDLLKDQDPINEGQALVITLTPDPGYILDYLKVNEKDHVNGAEYPVEKENVVITAAVKKGSALVSLTVVKPEGDIVVNKTTAPFTVTSEPEDADNRVTWSVKPSEGKPGKATITPDGRLRPEEAGFVKVVATSTVDPKITAELEVYIYIVPPIRITIPPIAAEQGTLTVKNQDDKELKDKEEVKAGDVLTITLTAKEGYKVKTFTVNDEEWANDKTFTVADKDVVIKAGVVAIYAITFAQPAEGGTFEVKNGDAAITTGTEIEEGTELTIKVTADENYEVDVVKAGDQPLAAEADGSYKFTVTAATEISVTFKEKAAAPEQFNVTAAVATNGSFQVLKDDEVQTLPKKFDKDTELTIKVTADENYEVDVVKAGDQPLAAEADGSYKFTVTADTEISVSFKEKAVTPTPTPLTVTIPKVENATLTVTKGGAELKDKEEVKEGDKLVITLTPAKGYKAKSLKVNDKDHTSGAEYTVGKENVVITAEVEADKSTPVDAERMFHYVVKTQGLEVTVEGVVGQSVRFVNVMGNVLFAVPQAANNAVTLRAPQAGIYIIQVGKATRVVSLQ